MNIHHLQKKIVNYKSLHFSVATIFLFLMASIGTAQVPMRAKDTKSTVSPSDFEQINLSNGSFSFRLPLISFPGRGIKNDLSLNIEQKWRQHDVIIGYSGGTPNVETRVEPDPYVGGLGPSFAGRMVGNSNITSSTQLSCGNDSRVVATTEFAFNFYGIGGQAFTFKSQQNDGAAPGFTETCGAPPSPLSIGTVFITWDGSGTKFIADNPIYIDDGGGAWYNGAVTNLDGALLPSGVIKLPDGTTYRLDSGSVSWAEDRNGNKTYTNITEGYGWYSNDTMNNQIHVSAINAQSSQQTISYKGFGGASRTITFGYNSMANCLRSDQSIQTKHQLGFTASSTNPSVNPQILCSVQMPNGQQYSLYYNSYQELARVVFPTGGAIEYDYESVGGNPLERRLIERRVYTAGSTLDNKTQYVYSKTTPSLPGNLIPSATNTTVKLIDNQNTQVSVSKHYFYGCIQDQSDCYVPGNWYAPQSRQALLTGREYESDIYAGDGTTLLRKTQTSFEARITASWPSYPPYKDYRVTQVVNTLADSGQVSAVTYSYDSSVAYNLETDAYEYDYGSGQAGSFVRRNHTDYQKGSSYTANSVNILDLPTQKWVSSDSGGNTKVSLTTFEYDNYSTDSTHAALVDRSNITSHDSSIGTSYTTRGNLTQTMTYGSAANQTGGVSTYAQYDIAGNVVKIINANGSASTISYNDNFGSPDDDATTNSSPSFLNGAITYAFASSATNPAGWTSYVQRDFYTGAVVDSQDINGNISTTYYNDSLDRPTQTITNNNRSTLRSQATVTYDDTNKKVTITADSKSYGDNLLKTEAYYDGFGRSVESRDYETSSNYIKTAAQYDSLGRAYKTCNPYRPYLSETAQWTTTAFDSMGRVTTVTTPDNAAASRSYYGSSTTVTDQAGRSRTGVTDALGRLITVREDPNGAQYDSLYTYDVLGRLRKTVQTLGSTTQNRYFMYDDLGRLMRAKLVEQGTNSNLNTSDPVTGNSSWSVGYTYDNNGNIATTTDALNRTITGTYDNLNRLTLRHYSDTSMPDVTFTYDDQNIVNSRGKLTAESSSVSATNYTAFDVLGRIKSSSQTTGGQTYAFSDYSYDLSGALVSETYPSGRVVTTDTDNIGRLADVKSQLPNSVQKVMLSELNYTSFGAVSQARLGNGKWEAATFDNKRLQITQIGLGGSAGDTSLLKLEFDYGTTANNGALLQQKITVPGASNQIIQNYTYDNLNRLATATETVNNSQTWKQTFSYDRFGNRRFDANNTTTFGSCSQQSCNPNVDQTKNQFSTSDGYSYDTEGNLTGSSYDSQTFSYDSENHLIQETNSATQTTGNYSYDGQGKRVKKSIGTQDTYFVYDAFGKLVAEYTVNQTPTQNGTQYLTADALGSPRVVTSAIGGVASRHDYMPFGEEAASGIGGRTTSQGYGQADNARQKFTGYERDDESGLDFAQNRYYSNKHGRFTSVDPLAASASIKAPQSLNRYSYGNNSPYKFTDSLGLKPCQVDVITGSGCAQETDPSNDPGDYYDHSGNYIGTDSNPTDGKVYFATPTGTKDGHPYIAVNSIEPTTMAKVERARVAAVPLSPGTGNETLKRLAGAVTATYDAGVTGIAKGITNAVIDTANSNTITLATGIGIPRFNPSNAAEASYASASEIGVMAGTVFAGGAVGGGSSLSVVPEASANVVPRMESVLGHIFRNAEGHVDPGTAASQGRFINLFERVANNPDNLNPAVQGFSQTFRSGQVWTQTYNGRIFNAGVNRIPR